MYVTCHTLQKLCIRLVNESGWAPEINSIGLAKTKRKAKFGILCLVLKSSMQNATNISATLGQMPILKSLIGGHRVIVNENQCEFEVVVVTVVLLIE